MARNQNSICDRTEKKTLGETRLSRGPVSLWPEEPVVCSSCSRLHWFQWSFPDGCLGDDVLTGDLSLGLIYVS